MRSFGLLFALALVRALGQSGATTSVLADAAWKPPSEFRQTLHAACDAQPAGSFGECFLGQMQAAQAPPAALAFARRTQGQGYLRAFRKTGRVDIAFAEYPFRANENQLCFLVNGDPPMIDVDAGVYLERSGLSADPAWQAIAREHPDAAIFPGDRFHSESVRASPRPGAGQRFVVPYSLHAGCHACAVVGTAKLAFDFDPDGHFLGALPVSVRPASPPR